jgi:CspA family cold shock protein
MQGMRGFEGAGPILAGGEPPDSFGLARGQDRAAATDGLMVEAAVKWFNPEKGYGFVELPGGGGDAFLHLKTLRQIGRQTLPSGAKVRALVRSGSRGAQVVRVIEVDTASAVERPGRQRRPAPDPSHAFDLTGKVKWFDDARGFGFVASDDFGRDVFVHSSTLAASGVAILLDGQAVSMRVVETAKGREAIAITA